MMKKKINIGLDIGITSCGWSIIDEDNNLIDFGSRLFDEPCDPQGKLKNQERREKRSLRRQIRRVKMRKHDFFKLLKKYGMFENKSITYEDFSAQINKPIKDENGKELTVLELKVKGLKEKLSEGLFQCLFHYIHHRGYFFIDAENKEEQNLENELISNDFPSVQQKKFFDEKGWYVGSKENLSFSNKMWLDEIKEFLKIQDLDPKFCDEYLALFQRTRSFADGPGSEKSPTPYGLYREKNGKVEKIGDNLWDITIGKCSIYPNELRGGKNSPIAEVYGLVQQLNLLYYIKDDNMVGLNQEAKEAIIAEFSKKLPGKKVKEKIMNIIQKFIPEINDFEKLGGVDEKRQPLFTELKSTIAIKKWLVENKIESDKLDVKNIDDLKKINRVFEILAKTTDLQARIEGIKKEYEKYNLSDESIKTIAKMSGLMTTSSYSYKAMLEYIPVGMSGNGEDGCQRVLPQQFFKDKIEANDIYVKLFKNKKYIPLQVGGECLFNNEVISPTTKRSFYQTIKVLNRIIKLYSNKYQFNNIVIEVARDRNSKEERDRIRDQNKKNENELSEIFLKNDYPEGIIKEEIKKLNSEKKLKIRLWNEQNGQDIYDGEKISFSYLMHNFDQFETDHIIPFEDSCDNSQTNKVLTKRINNWEKRKDTPWQHWGANTEKWTAFVNRVNQLYKDVNPKKIKLLLYEGDVRNDDGFIERNLVDTRYASRLVLDVIQKFFSITKINNSDENSQKSVKVKVIRGPITNYARYNLFWSHFDSEEKPRKGIFKDRDLYEHHAVDATIIAFLGSQAKINKRIEIYKLRQSENLKNKIDPETGEVIKPKPNFLYFSKEEHETLRKLSRQIEEKINKKECKFSRQMVVKNSITLSNDTIYSMKWNNDEHTNGYKIAKLSLLSTDSKEIEKMQKFFDENSKEKENLFCYKEDRRLYDILSTICKEYSDNPKIKNPFINYMTPKETDDLVETTDKTKPIVKQKKEKPIIEALVIENYNNSGKSKRVKFLHYKSDLKTEDNIIVLNSHTNNAFLESLNPLEARIYKVNTDVNGSKKLVVFPINALFLKNENGKAMCEEIKLKNFLVKKYPGIETSDYIKLTKGQTLIDKKTKKNLFYYVGGNFNQNQLEIKPVFCATEKYFSRPRWQQSISTINNEYELCRTDELGNIHDIKPIYDISTNLLGGGIYNLKVSK